FFLDGPGCTGKTFVYKALIAELRASQKVVVATAASGIASLLLEGGQTAHSVFKIPIPIDTTSTCAIEVESKHAKYLASADLIIIDEAPMMHRHVVEAIDRSLRDILRVRDPSLLLKPFGGNVLLLAGDFRQMLAVIPRGSRSQIVGSGINRSQLWAHFKTYRLHTNMRVSSDAMGWAARLLEIGGGIEGDDVLIPDEIARVESLSAMI
ncbi:TPA: hypothetical protein N0F65_002298, partial [Lagenidium giganteum]